MRLTLVSLGIVVVAAVPVVTFGQRPPDPAVLIPAQQEAIKRFEPMDGEWRGTAWTLLPSGEKHTLTQTERVGSFLDGTVKVIDGRGYEEDGHLSFSALGVISYNPETKAYSLRSYAQGREGDFVITPTDKGFQWEIPAGPVTIRYTAEVGDGTWHEVGDRIVPGQEPMRFFEMTLSRIGDTSWPAAGVVPRQ